MSAGERRHRVNIYDPTKAQGLDGQLQGQDVVIYREVPCSIETLGGSESEVANQQTAITNYRVTLYGDPNKPIHHACYLTLGPRKLHIQAIDDRHQNGTQLTLLCGERHQ